MTLKSGIYILAELRGPVADRIAEIQRRYDPRLAATSPPHITLAGSSGIGPLPKMPVEELRAGLEPITSDTPPIEIRFGPPIRFMQTDIIVLPTDPHGPLRALHERLKSSGLPFPDTRHVYTPHCTLSYYPTLDAATRKEMLALRITEPVVIDRLQCYHTVNPQSKKLLELPLTGGRTPGARR